MNTVNRLAQELRVYLRLSGPILVAQMAQMSMGVTDVIMSGRVSATDLSAVAIGSSLMWPCFFLLGGTVLSNAPLCARLFGARARLAIGSQVRQCLMVGVVCAMLGFFVLRATEGVLPLFDITGEIAELTGGYVRAVSWGMWGLVLFNVLRAFSEGINLTMPVAVLSVAGALINIPVNYVFIYGKLGLPALGGVGCGYATSLVMTLMFLCMLGTMLLMRHYRPFRLFRRWEWPDVEMVREIVAVGFPIGAAVFVEITLFLGAALLLGPLGQYVIAGHQIALNIAGVAFMVPLSISMAATIRIGNLIGADDWQRVQFSTRVVIALTAVLALLNCTLMLVLNETLVSLYGTELLAQKIAVGLVLFAALFQLPDCMQAVLVGILRAYKDTLSSMLVMIVSYWLIALPLGYMLALTDLLGPRLGVEGLWFSMIVGLVISSLLLAGRTWYRAQQYRLSYQVAV